jgi:threonine aldolase
VIDPALRMSVMRRGPLRPRTPRPALSPLWTDRSASSRRLLAEKLSECPHVDLDLTTVQTNIIVFHLQPGGPDAAKFVAKAKERDVLAVAFGPRIVRVVTHLDVTSEQCEHAASILAAVAEGR